MKVLVLGAAGRLGRRMAWRLAESGSCEHIFVADENAQGVNNLVGDIGRPDVSARYLDASDPSSIESRMREADVALGFVGPFHRYEKDMVQAAIHTGTHYLSVCNDPAGTRAALDAHAEAERARVIVGTGLGWSPGLSNLLAMHAATSMERVRSVRIFWAEAGPGSGLASLLHYAGCLAGEAPVRQSSAEAQVESGSWEEWVFLPGPLRRIAAVYSAHPEPLTLPRSLPGVEEVSVKGGFGSQPANLAMRMLAWALQNRQPGTRDIVCASCQGPLTSLKIAGDDNRQAALRVAVQGTREGAAFVRILGASGSFAETAVNMVGITLDKLMAGDVPAGVHPPEELWEPREVFQALAARDVRFWREGGAASQQTWPWSEKA